MDVGKTKIPSIGNRATKKLPSRDSTQQGIA